eukprot:CAMPEP_0183829990 /NCGR_PEP_ID=MMETSP0807_2-20130328/3750_1 /TAXON_ID=88271 /ORGANISM="Picocystis salinarum, Strain CCMP1897" /LENGTH=2784 /DNA_ID=CAMNT_0026075313 /DNA_START=47 /DNA_END=8401 /DNA_ORIENTATION=+
MTSRRRKAYEGKRKVEGRKDESNGRIEEEAESSENEEPPTCALCLRKEGEAGIEAFDNEDLCWFYDPNDETKAIACHDECVLYASGIRRDKGNVGYEQIRDEVRRCARLKCIKCGKATASVGCVHETCHRSYHYTCLVELATQKVPRATLASDMCAGACTHHMNFFEPHRRCTLGELLQKPPTWAKRKSEWKQLVVYDREWMTIDELTQKAEEEWNQRTGGKGNETQRPGRSNPLPWELEEWDSEGASALESWAKDVEENWDLKERGPEAARGEVAVPEESLAVDALQPVQPGEVCSFCRRCDKETAEILGPTAGNLVALWLPAQEKRVVLHEACACTCSLFVKKAGGMHLAVGDTGRRPRPTDIGNVLATTSSWKCGVCKKGNATIACIGVGSRKCKSYYHLPCVKRLAHRNKAYLGEDLSCACKYHMFLVKDANEGYLYVHNKAADENIEHAENQSSDEEEDDSCEKFDDDELWDMNNADVIVKRQQSIVNALLSSVLEAPLPSFSPVLEDPKMVQLLAEGLQKLQEAQITAALAGTENLSCWNEKQKWDDDVDRARDILGYSALRPGQRAIINATIAGNDVLVIWPTGGGKSLLFQLPCAMQRAGVTLLLVPLRALASQHVKWLNKHGINTVWLDGFGGDAEAQAKEKEVLEDIMSPASGVRCMVATPEKVTRNTTVRVVLKRLGRIGRLRRIVFDECHVLLDWSNSFKPDYAKLAGLRAELGMPPVLALTAAPVYKDRALLCKLLGLESTLEMNGTEEVLDSLDGLEENGIADQKLGQSGLCLEQSKRMEKRWHLFCRSTRRDNLRFEVWPKPADKHALAWQLADYLNLLQKNPETILGAEDDVNKADLPVFQDADEVDRSFSGLVFVSTRKETHEVAKLLAASGMRGVAAYHGRDTASMTGDRQEKLMKLWQCGKLPVLVTTPALGLGVDKPNVRFVVHWSMPGSLRALLQEAGRAGRDGKPALALLLYSFSDTQVHEALILNELQKAAAAVVPFISSSGNNQRQSLPCHKPSVAEEYSNRRTELLKVVAYAENMTKCRKRVLENGLKDGLAPSQKCVVGCDVCTPRDENNMVTTKNVTVAAIAIIKLLAHTGALSRSLLMSVLNGKRVTEVRPLIPEQDQNLLGSMSKQAGISDFVLERIFVGLLLDGVLVSSFQPNPSEMGTGSTKFAVEMNTARRFLAKYSSGANKYEISYWNPYESDDSDDMCAVCGDFGELLCCDGANCTRAYHLDCLQAKDRPKEELDGEDSLWLCPVCSSKGAVERKTLKDTSKIGICPNSFMLENRTTFGCVGRWSREETRKIIRSLPHYRSYLKNIKDGTSSWQWNADGWYKALVGCGINVLETWVAVDEQLPTEVPRSGVKTRQKRNHSGPRPGPEDTSVNGRDTPSQRWFLCWWGEASRSRGVKFLFFDARLRRMYKARELLKVLEQEADNPAVATYPSGNRSTLGSQKGRVLAKSIFQATIQAVDHMPDICRQLQADPEISLLLQEAERAKDLEERAEMNQAQEEKLGKFEQERAKNIQRNQGYLNQLMDGALDTNRGELEPDTSRYRAKGNSVESDRTFNESDGQISDPIHRKAVKDPVLEQHSAGSLPAKSAQPIRQQERNHKSAIDHVQQNGSSHPQNGKHLHGKHVLANGEGAQDRTVFGDVISVSAVATSPLQKASKRVSDHGVALTESDLRDVIEDEYATRPKRKAVSGHLSDMPSKVFLSKRHRSELPLQALHPIEQKTAVCVQASPDATGTFKVDSQQELRDVALAEAVGLVLPAQGMPERLLEHLHLLSFRQRFLLEEVCSKAGWEAIDGVFIQEWVKLAQAHDLMEEFEETTLKSGNLQAIEEAAILPNLQTSTFESNDKRRFGMLLLRRFLEEAVAKHSAIGKAELRVLLTSVLDTLKESNSKTWQNKRFADVDEARFDAMLEGEDACRLLPAGDDDCQEDGTAFQRLAPCTPEASREMYSAVYRAGKLHLVPVLCRTKGCRAFRKFGCSRFLFLKIPTKHPKQVESLLQTPLRIAGRKFEFVFSKPLDETAVYFATEGHGIAHEAKFSVEKFRKWAVPLPGEKSSSLAFGKYASRFELSFSESDPASLIYPKEVIFIDDDDTQDVEEFRVEARTDGCGLMRDDLADEVASSLQIGTAPAAVQARWGGSKGVWLVVPANEWRYGEDKRFAIRASQVKYTVAKPESFHITLDVLMTIGARGSRRAHAPSLGRLTKQVIPLLVHRGVSLQTLLILQSEALADIESRLLGSRGAVAEELRHADGALANEALSMVLAGFDPVNSVHLRKMLLRLIEKRKVAIREHRIPLTLAQTALIVPDPYRVLGPGEVYLNSTQRLQKRSTLMHNEQPHSVLYSGNPFGPIEGDVVLFRSPTHLPEDVVAATAVRCPSLRAYEDVLVVNVVDEVSIAQRLSGGDYDGDHAVVIWDPRIVEPVHESSKRRGSPALVSEEEMLEIASSGRDRALCDGEGGDDDFVLDNKTGKELVLRDSRPLQPSVAEVGGIAAACTLHCVKHLWTRQNVGEIDILHRIGADRFGPSSTVARQLALKARMALDAAKHGGDAKAPTGLRTMLFQGARPHFLQKRTSGGKEKASKNSAKIYHSRSALGQMFDQLQQGTQKTEMVSWVTGTEQGTDADASAQELSKDGLEQDLLVPGHDSFLPLARRLKASFYSTYQSLLKEIPAGEYRLEKHQRLRSEAWCEARDASREEFRRCVHSLQESLQLASACYRVGVLPSSPPSTRAHAKREDSGMDGAEHLFHWAVAGEFLQRIKADAVAYREKGTISHSVTRLR